MIFDIFSSSLRGASANCRYPEKKTIRNAEDLKEAAGFDHVAVEFKDSYRSRKNFIASDVVVMDCDNGDTDNPDDWVKPEMLQDMFPDTAFAVVPSRNNEKEKDGKSARPRFHVYFPIKETTDEKAYTQLKRRICRGWPFFDSAALDSARFLYGTPADSVLWHDGSETIEEMVVPPEKIGTIPKGQRNSTMSRFAGRVIKRYGPTDKAYGIFMDEAEKCDPPLEDEELDHIWQSALRFGKRVAAQEGYISPEKYNNDFGTVKPLKPSDYSDIGQAKVLVREYGSELKYTPATEYLRYDGKRWVESKQRAVGAMEEFLDLQLAEAQDALANAVKALKDGGIKEEVIRSGGKALEKQIEKDLAKAYDDYLSALQYQKFILKRRDMKYVMSALQAAKPMLEISYDDLDSDPFLLNCPDGTYDLRQGTSKKKEHNARDLITKITAAAPGDEGKEIWLDSVNRTFSGDQELIDYVQKIAGLCAIGQVELEALIISYGEGSNGKSTFWNTIAGVLGNYSGNISADTLTVNCRRNVKPELAEAKGKRLLIAAELEEGMRISTSVVKQLCSTDRIAAEKKYKDPASFTPSHTLVLYTNHLPRVGAMDAGIWRRLIVIPFLATITGEKDIKNYSQYLQAHASPYIMKWIMEGAEKAIQCGFNFEQPACVKKAISEYRAENDWMTHFIEDCCEEAPNGFVSSGKLYEEYRAFCNRTGEYVRTANEFIKTLEQRGYERRRKKEGRYILGLHLKVKEFLSEE